MSFILYLGVALLLTLDSDMNSLPTGGVANRSLSLAGVWNEMASIPTTESKPPTVPSWSPGVDINGSLSC